MEFGRRPISFIVNTDAYVSGIAGFTRDLPTAETLRE